MFSTYNFDNMTNVNNDKLYVTQKSMQDNNIYERNMQNFFSRDTYMANPISMAISQPGVQFKGGYNVSHDGQNIDVSSKLSLGSMSEMNNGPISLTPRPFLSVPYLGRGTVDPNIEMEMKKGLQYSNKKTNINASENSTIHMKYTPLLQEIESQLSNPSRYAADNHCCGQASRESQRDDIRYKR